MPIEEKIKSIVAELLGIEGIEYDVPLSEYGIDSITILQLIVRIEEETNIALSAIDVFERPTIRQISDYIIQV